MLEFGVGLIGWLRANAVIDFAIAVCLVAVGLEVLGQRYEIGPLGYVAKPGSQSVDASRAWPQTYHEAGSRGIAERGLAVGIIHQRAPFRELVDVWRLHFGMEIHAADPVILVVDRYE